MTYKMKHQIKYLIYVIALFFIVSLVSAERTTKINEDTPIIINSMQIASTLEETDVAHCYYADESYAVYHNGLWWAWVAPIAQSDWGLVPDASLIGDGWRNVADEDEWALRPDPSAFISTDKCAATYFFPLTPWCDWNDPVTYYIDGTLSEFWVVHDDCEDNSTTVTCYIDADMDGYGSDTTIISNDGTCDTEQGESTNSGDCNDADTSINPSATEICNDIDDDCNGELDEGLDTDNDGVYGCAIDQCLNTESDPWTSEDLGINRYMWNDVWTMKKPKEDIVLATDINMEYTYGCSCTQLLDAIAAETGRNLGGHYRFGCSRSMLTDWHDGTYYVNDTLI